MIIKKIYGKFFYIIAEPHLSFTATQPRFNRVSTVL